MYKLCVTNTMGLIHRDHKKENISGGFPASSDNASFIIRLAHSEI